LEKWFTKKLLLFVLLPLGSRYSSSIKVPKCNYYKQLGWSKKNVLPFIQSFNSIKVTSVHKVHFGEFFLWVAMKFNLPYIYEVLQSECTCLNESWEENLLSFLDFSLTSLESVTFKVLNGNFQNLIPTMIVSNNLKKYTNFKSINRCKITNESEGVVICGTVIFETFKLLFLRHK
jgi:hypothetical protein